jgi:hypothetical protein
MLTPLIKFADGTAEVAVQNGRSDIELQLWNTVRVRYRAKVCRRLPPMQTVPSDRSTVCCSRVGWPCALVSDSRSNANSSEKGPLGLRFFGRMQ